MKFYRTTLNTCHDAEGVVCATRAECLFAANFNIASATAKRIRKLNPAQPDFPRTDLEHALRIDQFDFTMEVERRDDLLVLRGVN